MPDALMMTLVVPAETPTNEIVLASTPVSLRTDVSATLAVMDSLSTSTPWASVTTTLMWTVPPTATVIVAGSRVIVPLAGAGGTIVAAGFEAVSGDCPAVSDGRGAYVVTVTSVQATKMSASRDTAPQTNKNFSQNLSFSTPSREPIFAFISSPK